MIGMIIMVLTLWPAFGEPLQECTCRRLDVWIVPMSDISTVTLYFHLVSIKYSTYWLSILIFVLALHIRDYA